MPKNFPRPNDPDDYDERVEKTIRNMEAAEFAAEFAEGKELEAIKAKNRRRLNSLRGTHPETERE